MSKHTPPALQYLQDLEAAFADVLSAQRFWDILPADQDEPLGLFDTQTALRYPSVAAFQAFVEAHPFLYLQDAKGQWQATLQTRSRLLWCHEASRGGKSYTVEQARALLKTANWAGLQGWKIPSKDELREFATTSGNPHRVGSNYRFAPPASGEWGELREFATTSGNQRRVGSNYRFAPPASGEWGEWLVSTGQCDVDSGYWGISSSASGGLFACWRGWKDLPWAEWLLMLAKQSWQLLTPDDKQRFQPKTDKQWQGLNPQQLMLAMASSGERLRAGKHLFNFAPYPALASLAELDYRPSRLPKLEAMQLTDPHKGVWELWGADSAALARWGNLVARNPANDVRNLPVAIDFGTSSTVVAVYNGQYNELLRIGARDFYKPIEPSELENPTVIECLDFAAFWAEWQRTSYRPAHDWDWLRMGHEAQSSWRDNPGDTAVLASILPRLKPWAARNPELPPLRLTDRLKQQEIEIPPLQDLRPVAGQLLQLGQDYPFDPIEFYAWQLGMAINWRGRGLFLEYYLSFPAKYARALKDNILASFQRGLQRSLPLSLLQQEDYLTRFQVRELASEPAAYAAAALPHLELQPTAEGLAYAVFDFGGGTTDFDFGLWRLPTVEEEDSGYEQTFVHLASSGDNYLGGEYLLENLAYHVFAANLEVLRDKRIHFTRPADALLLVGTEAFIHPTQAAQTNSVLLIAKLRPFWESADGKLDSQLKLELLDSNGTKQEVTLTADAEALEKYLQARIQQGVQFFLDELARAFSDLPADAPVHILLAGNASHSRHVSTAFDPNTESWQHALETAFAGRQPPLLTVHPPLAQDAQHLFAPTAKTGVALGLLRLAPGAGVQVIDQVRDASSDETPFRYFVGRLRGGVFQAALAPQTPYGAWCELGPVNAGIFNLRYTLSLRARQQMLENDPELRLLRLSYPEARAGARLWARPVAPSKIEITLGVAGTPPAANALCQTLDLEH